MRVAYDMSSVIWTCLLVGKDAEGVEVMHEDKAVWVNSAAYGYENAVNMMLAPLREYQCTPSDMILVAEGKSSKKRRTMIFPEYKGNRDARPPQAYEQFTLCRDMLINAFLARGAIAVTQDFVEGDDILAYLADNCEEDLLIVTNDNDLVTLNKTNAYGSQIKVRVNGKVGHNKYGEFDLGLVTLYKTLVGDTSDNIKGCPGFGAKAFLQIMARYNEDGCWELLRLISEGKSDELAQIAEDNKCKYLLLIIDKWQEVGIAYRLAMLHPEWVNTNKQQLRWTAGVVSKDAEDSRLNSWKLQQRLVTADNYDAALKFLQDQILYSPFVAFDIETSTPDESMDWCEAAGVAVDVIGSYLVGFSICFGSNLQYVYYVSVKHYDTANITMVQARKMIEVMRTRSTVIHNMNFELPVLYNAQDEDGTYWHTHWSDVDKGFIPNCLDTKIESSYVNENMKNGLKERSLHHLGYTQESFDHVTKLAGQPFPGGQAVKVKTEEGLVDGRQYRMHELTAQHVFSYGADDAMVTAALHNFYKLHMGLDHHYQVYQKVEIAAAYLHAQSFVEGVQIDVGRCKSLEREDDATHAAAWAVMREYLMSVGWAGTIPPKYVGEELTAKKIKEAYAIVTDQLGADDEAETEEDAEPVEEVNDPVLKSKVRTPSKLAVLISGAGQEELAAFIEEAIEGNAINLERYVLRHFKGEPVIKFSNVQMCRLMYETMGLPIKVRNKPTAAMKAKGLTEGNPKADALAIEYALRDGDEHQKKILESIKLMQMVRTRKSLYYSKYPYFVHWKTGKVHSSHNQCGTNTRRASSSAPNFQQLPKHPKVEGQPAKFREVVVPHKQDAVVVSMDFSAQELRVIAEYSQDKNMLACYVGTDKRDMHALTGLGILKQSQWVWAALVEPHKVTYDEFMAALNNKGDVNHKLAKEARTLGKKVNFTTEYGAAKAKLAQTLLVSEDEAQKYIDAKEAAFPRATAWKEEVIDEAKGNGYVTTMLGAKRHLAELFNNEDRFIASKADRQAVNFKIQSSSAEMTKLAEGRMWEIDLVGKYDCTIIGPIHDEVVASCAIKDLPGFIADMHKCMVDKYGSMLIPIESSISFGPNFAQQIEIGDKPTVEAVEYGIKQLMEKV